MYRAVPEKRKKFNFSVSNINYKLTYVAESVALGKFMHTSPHSDELFAQRHRIV
jgi:hypothetical protein